MAVFIAILIPFVILLPTVAWLAGRFARRRRREGAWDEHGPKQPSEPPAGFGHPLRSSDALDRYLAAVLRRGRRHGRQF
jgi:hypothetical protein